MPGTFAPRVGGRAGGRAAHARRWAPAAAGGPPPQQGPWLVLFHVKRRRRHPGSRSAAAGWRLPAERELNVLFETAEYARFAIRVAWAAMAWLHDGAEWVPVELAEIARWFEAWRPVLDEKNYQS